MSETNALTIKLGLTGLSSVQSGFREIQEGATRISESVKELAIGFAEIAGIALTLEGIREGFAGIIEAGSQLELLHERTGASTAMLAELSIAMKDAGLDGNAAGQMMNRMSKELVNAEANGGPVATAIADLHLNLRDLLEMVPDEQFRKIAVAIASMENPTLRAAAATQLFGRSGGALIPVFNAMRQASEDTGFASLLGRNAAMFHEIEVGMDRIKRAGQGLFLGILDQLGPQLNEFVKRIGSIDLTGMGRDIGAFAQIAIDAWKRGKFGEFVELSIRAAFEVGEDAADKFCEYAANAIDSTLGSSQFWSHVWMAFDTVAFASMSGLTRLFMWIEMPWVSLWRYLWDTVETLGHNAFERIKAQFQTIKTLASGIGHPFNMIQGLGTGTSGTEGLHPDIKPMPSFTEKWMETMENTSILNKAIKDTYIGLTSALHDFLGLGITFGKAGTSARDTFRQLFAGKRGARDAKAAGGEEAEPDFSGFAMPVDQFKLAQAAIERTKNSLIDMDEALVKLQTNWTETSQEKWQVRKTLLEDERAELQELVALLQKAANAEADSKKRQEITAKLDEARGQLKNKDKEIGSLGPDPNKFGQQWTAAFTKMKESIGTSAQQISQIITGTITHAVNGLANALTNVIMGSQSAAAAFEQFGMQMLASFIESILAAIIWAKIAIPILTYLGIVSGGATTAPGMAAIGIATMTASTVGFAGGGYTGSGAKWEPAGIVHRGEYVVTADDLNAMGGPKGLESRLYGANGGGAGNRIDNRITFGVYSDRSMVADFLKSSEGRKIFVDLSKQHAHEIGQA